VCCRIRQKGGRGFSASENMIFEIDFPDKTGFQKQNMLFFARKYPLPVESGFLTNQYVVSGLHNDFSFPDYVKQGISLPGGFGILVWMIFIGAPHTGQVIFTRSFIFLINVLSGLTRRTICRNLMSFLLHGWRKP